MTLTLSNRSRFVFALTAVGKANTSREKGHCTTGRDLFILGSRQMDQMFTLTGAVPDATAVPCLDATSG